MASIAPALIPAGETQRSTPPSMPESPNEHAPDHDEQDGEKPLFNEFLHRRTAFSAAPPLEMLGKGSKHNPSKYHCTMTTAGLDQESFSFSNFFLYCEELQQPRGEIPFFV
jgi:hypothetical protein